MQPTSGSPLLASACFQTIWGTRYWIQCILAGCAFAQNETRTCTGPGVSESEDSFGKSSKATGLPDARQEYLLFGKNHVWSKDCLCKSSQHVCLRSAVIFGSSSRIGELLMRKKRKPRHGKKHWLRPKRKRIPRCKPQTKQATRAVSMTVDM